MAKKLGDAPVGTQVRFPDGDMAVVMSHDPARGSTTVTPTKVAGVYEKGMESMSLSSNHEIEAHSSPKNSSDASSSSTGSGGSTSSASRGDSMAHSSFESAKSSGDFTGNRSSWNSYKAASEASKKK